MEDATNSRAEEGGFALNILGNKDAMRNATGKTCNIGRVSTNMHVVASEFFRLGKCHLDFKSPDGTTKHLTLGQLADLCRPFVLDYPVDSSDQHDWEA